MNVINLAIGALAGLLAALIASVLVRDARENRGRYGATFAISFAVLFGLANVFVYPGLNGRYQAGHVESELLESPAFRALKQHDRATYDKLVAEMKQSLKDGKGEGQIIANVRGHITKVVQVRLPRASNEAVASYMKVMLVEMDELNQQGGDLCYRFLFPQPSGPIDPNKHFSKKTQEADLAALAQVIKSSAEDPQPVPQEAEVLPTLTPIYLELATEHGEDIAMLQNPTAPSVDRRKICAMSKSIYTKILRLPVDDSGRVLRYLLGQ